MRCRTPCSGAWRGLGQFEGRSSVRTWLYRIATRVCLTFATRPLVSPGRRLIATRANGCPALGCYHLAPDGTYAAHSIQVLEAVDGKVSHIYAFLDTDLFLAFRLPLSLAT